MGLYDGAHQYMTYWKDKANAMAVGNSAQGSAQGVGGNPMAAGVGGAGGGESGAAMNALAASIGGTGSAPARSTALGNVAPGSTTPGRAGTYYGDLTDVGTPYYLNNPQALIQKWADFYNQGQGRAALINQNFDPNSILLASGGANADKNKQMDAMGYLANLLTGRSGGGQMHLNPEDLMKNVLGASYDPKNPNQLSETILDPSMAPDTQVKNTIGLILGSMQGSVSNQTLNNYANFLTNEARLYMEQISTAHGNSPLPSFNAWLQARHGSGGGLF